MADNFMNEDRSLEENMKMASLLELIRNSLDEKKYPGTAEALERLIGQMSSGVVTPLYCAGVLMEADATGKMPEDVASLCIDIYEKEVKKGSFEAMCNLGYLYYTGRGGEQSFEKAFELFNEAACQSDAEAEEDVAYCYYYGRGVEQNYEKAYKYFVKGALKQRLTSYYKLGDMYRYGLFVEKDEDEAFRIYDMVYHTMDEDSMKSMAADVAFRLGDCFFEGIGTEQNYDLAMMFYNNAERLFTKRYMEGDFFIRSNLEKCIHRQFEARMMISEQMPDYDWVNIPGWLESESGIRKAQRIKSAEENMGS